MHTRGPWKYEKTSTGILHVFNTVNGRAVWTIAEVYKNLDGVNNEELLKESEANARLIAAAPELLEACKELTGYCGNEAFDRSVKKAQRVIAKTEEGAPVHKAL